MNFAPILSALLRHKIAAALIALQIALSCAIICNALFMIRERMQRMDRPTGMNEAALVTIQAAGIGQGDNAAVRTREDLALLRNVPGVREVTIANQIPFGGSSWNSGVKLDKDQHENNLLAANYFGDENFVRATGLQLIAGRDFGADDMVEWAAIEKPGSKVQPHVAIVSKSMADALFPGQDPLGKTFHMWGEEPQRIVGVVAHFARTNDQQGPAAYEYAALLPAHFTYENAGSYVLQVADPSQREAVLAAAVKALESAAPNRMITRKSTFEDLRLKYYRKDKLMAGIFVAVCVALLVITALGIVGLASFWVQQRTRQIGVRRALGATRGDILRYFQTENFLIVSGGIALGMLLAFAINQLLMAKYELPRLPWWYLPIGAIVLWLLGQLAVLWPALRAAAIPPATATRSV